MYTIGTFYKDVFEYLDEHAKERFLAEGIDYYFIDRKKLAKDETVDLLITGTLTDDEMAYFPNLSGVFVPYTGLNGLNIRELESHNIRIYNTSAHGFFVAERALGLTLAVMGKIVSSHNGMVAGSWKNRGLIEQLYWTSLKGKKIGIYGYGTIGQAVHDLVKPFQVEVGILNYKDRVFEDTIGFDHIETLAAWCDVLIIAAPLTEGTKGSINSKVFEALKACVLINIARGTIIDEDALYKALEAGSLKGFGSDVWFNYPTKEVPECEPSNYDLSQFNQVVMTPHNAGLEESSKQVRYDDVIKQISNINL